MAKKKDRDALAITRLTPNAIDVSIDGEDVRVPTTKSENAVMNQILAAQMRNIFQRQIKSYKDDEAKMTPKELSELARAARDIAAFSTEVYAANETIEPPKEKSSPIDDDPLDFSKLGKVEEVKEEEKNERTT